MRIRERCGGFLASLFFLFLPKSVIAFTLYPWIFYRERPYARERMHEFTLAEKVQQLGWIRFYSRYFLQLWKHGHEHHPMELEAIQLVSRPEWCDHLARRFPQLEEPIA